VPLVRAARQRARSGYPVASPDPRRSLAVAPLTRNQRCYGESPARVRRGYRRVGGKGRCCPNYLENRSKLLIISMMRAFHPQRCPCKALGFPRIGKSLWSSDIYFNYAPFRSDRLHGVTTVLRRWYDGGMTVVKRCYAGTSDIAAACGKSTRAALQLRFPAYSCSVAGGYSAQLSERFLLRGGDILG
jgi:hypothetical protein